MNELQKDLINKILDNIDGLKMCLEILMDGDSDDFSEPVIYGEEILTLTDKLEDTG